MQRAWCSRRAMGMLSSFLAGTLGYLPPRLALAFSQGGSITIQSKPPSGAPVSGQGKSFYQCAGHFMCWHAA